jgi:gliding motility-associated-like protein
MHAHLLRPHSVFSRLLALFLLRCRGWQFQIGILLLLWAAPPASAQTWELLERLQSEQTGSSLGALGLASNGDAVVTGGMSGTVPLPGVGTISSTGYSDGFVARRSAQTGRWLWATSIRTLYGNFVGQLLVLPDDDILVMGSFYSSVSLGPRLTLSGQGTYDGYVGRLNGATGEWRWVAQLATRGANTHARPSAMALRANGELVVTGAYSGQLQLGNLPQLVSSRPGGFGTFNFDLFVARLNSATGEWLQGFGAGGLGSDEATDVLALPGGDIALAGTVVAPLTLGGLPGIGGRAAPRAFVARLDPVGGTWRWAQLVAADLYANGQRLTALPDGDLAVSGKYAGTAHFDGLVLPPGLGPVSSFVARLRADTGQWRWATSGGGTGRPLGSGGLAATPDGNLIIANMFSEQGRFGSLPPVSSVSVDPDIFVGQLNGITGQWQWLTLAAGTGGSTPYTFGGDDVAGELLVLNNRQVLLAGTFSNTARLGNLGPLPARLRDGFLARITIPTPCTDTPDDAAPAGWRIAADSADCAPGRTLRVVGAPAGSSLAWNTGSAEPAIRATEPGRYSVLVSTLAGCRVRLHYALTPASTAALGPIPNIITPNADGQNDYWKIPGLPAGSSLQLFNRWGQQVYHTASYTNDWDAKDLPAGTYYYVLEHPQLCPAPRLKGWVEVVR